MTDELRDYTTPPGWTRADTDRLLDAALLRDALQFPDYINYSLPAYRAIHGGTLPDLHEQRERRTLYLTEGRARSRP